MITTRDLLLRLDSPDSEYRDQAARTLAGLDEKYVFTAIKQASVPLLQWRLRANVAAMLGQILSARSVDWLVKHLADEQVRYVQRAQLVALAQLRRQLGEEFNGPFLDAMNSLGDTGRRHIAEALRSCGHEGVPEVYGAAVLDLRETLLPSDARVIPTGTDLADRIRTKLAEGKLVKTYDYHGFVFAVERDGSLRILADD